MSVYVTDSHPLIWFAGGAHSKLSKKALRIFEAALRSEALIYIPAVSLWEIGILAKIGRIKLREPYDIWSQRIIAARGFNLAPLDTAVMIESLKFGFTEDVFDAAITATASVLDLPLITKDSAITQAQLVDVIW